MAAAGQGRGWMALALLLAGACGGGGAASGGDAAVGVGDVAGLLAGDADGAGGAPAGDSAAPDGGDGGDAGPELPVEPPASFFEAPDENHAVLAFKGLINAQETAAAGKATLGIGEAAVYLGADTALVGENFAASRLVIPDDYVVLEMRGDDYLRIDGYEVVEARPDGARTLSFGAGLPVDALVAMRSAGVEQAPLPAWSWLNLFDVDYTLRADGTAFTRYCWRTHADYESPDSRVWVKPGHNEGFGAGEDLIVWIHAVVLPAAVVTGETEAQLCTYYVGAAEVDGPTWYEERAKDPAAFDCALPEGYLDPPGGDHLALQFVGTLNDFNNPTPTPISGFGDAAAVIGGKELVIDDYRVSAGRFFSLTLDVIYLQTLGSVVVDGADYTSLVSETYLDVAAAKQLGEGEYLIENDAEDWTDYAGVRFSTVVKSVEQIAVDGHAWLRHCPLAVTDLTQPASSVFVCHSGDATFAAGTELQLAMNQSLTSDPAAIQEWSGVSAPCWCTVDDLETVDCADFDAL